jgi:hypothetical protein
MPKPPSDVFICRLGDEDYWAYPSPFVAHGVGTKIRFRNMTKDEIDIHFGDAPVDKKALHLKADAMGEITVHDKGPAGLYLYEALVAVPPPPGAVPGKPPVAVQVRGGSSPKIIIDT